MNNQEIKIGQIWKHYKGNHYKIIVVGVHSETGEELVAYQRQEDGKVYFRPIELFFSNVEKEGETVPRFILTTV